MSKRVGDGNINYPYVVGALSIDIKEILKSSKVFIHILEKYPPK